MKTPAKTRPGVKKNPAGSSHDPETLKMLGRLLERELQRAMRALGAVEGGALERRSDPLDMAAELISRQTEAAAQARTANALQELTAALRRHRESPSTFGVCERCAALIPAERMEIIPTARTCVACN